MMVTTHVLAGMAVAAVVAVVAPEYAPAAVLGAGIGGFVPDLDLYAGHRRTLHYPVYFTAAAVPAGVVAVLHPSTATVALAFCVLGAALHSVMDAFGGGLELRPWRGESDRAVFDHFRGRWIAPRRWIRYDGAPEDVGAAALFGLPILLAFGPAVDRFVLGVLAVSAGYALVRKRLVGAAEWLVSRVPLTVIGYLPARFTEGLAEP